MDCLRGNHICMNSNQASRKMLITVKYCIMGEVERLWAIRNCTHGSAVEQKGLHPFNSSYWSQDFSPKQLAEGLLAL